MRHEGAKFRRVTSVSAFIPNGVFLRPLLLILCLVIFLPIANPLAATITDCQKMKTDLEQKKQKLREYSETLRRENTNGDPQILGALSNQINELIRHIRAAEDDMEGCMRVESLDVMEGTALSKSDEEEYAAKNCDELKRMVIPLLRTINRLERREHSLFSQLSHSEKAELMEARQKIAKVQAALGVRCSPAASRGRKR